MFPDFRVFVLGIEAFKGVIQMDFSPCFFRFQTTIEFALEGFFRLSVLFFCRQAIKFPQYIWFGQAIQGVISGELVIRHGNRFVCFFAGRFTHDFFQFAAQLLVHCFPPPFFRTFPIRFNHDFFMC